MISAFMAYVAKLETLLQVRQTVHGLRAAGAMETALDFSLDALATAEREAEEAFRIAVLEATATNEAIAAGAV